MGAPTQETASRIVVLAVSGGHEGAEVDAEKAEGAVKRPNLATVGRARRADARNNSFSIVPIEHLATHQRFGFCGNVERDPVDKEYPIGFCLISGNGCEYPTRFTRNGEGLRSPYDRPQAVR